MKGGTFSAVKFILDWKVRPQRADLFALLKHSRICGASDKRDNVYAFLGLLDHDSSIRPDYVGKSVEDVFTEAARSNIERDLTLGILLYASCSRTHLSATLPSWVPNWTSPQIALPKDKDLDLLAPSPPRSKDAVTFWNNGRVLEVSGLFAEKLTAAIRVWIPSTYLQFRKFVDSTAKETFLDIRAQSYVLPGDELWLLFVATTPVVLREMEGNEKDDEDSDQADTRKETLRQGVEEQLCASPASEGDYCEVTIPKAAKRPQQYQYICDVQMVDKLHFRMPETSAYIKYTVEKHRGPLQRVRPY
ncbi:hypothetical protein EK21DRAFT_114449 [Setomelanomma holmii]|uniref:Uncharacterized protein n=1 Tax=Setomelanomma holmii TaxID=210430 RepID=A0A9P4LJN1_9PLEO|nr:hypothetical protein EK21DRAFT_114449 [Setomelanomma holmii]